MRHTRWLSIFFILLVPFPGLTAQTSGFRNTIQDFQPQVIDFREDGLPGGFRRGVLVEPSPGDLVVGDVFIDVDGLARKVSRVQKVGRDIFIDTVQPRFDEVYVYVEIPPQTLSLTSPVSPGGPSRGTFDISFEKEIYNKAPSVIKIKAGAVVTSNLSIGFKSPSCVQVIIRSWKFWEWTVGFRYERGYVEAKLDYDLALSGGLNFAVSKSLECPAVLLYGFGTPTPGIAANLGLFGKAVMEGELALDLPFTFDVAGSAQVKCTLDGQVPYMVPTDTTASGNIKYAVSLDPALTAEAALKLKCYLGANLTLVGLEIADFEAGGGPYLKINGTLNASIGYDSVEGMTGPTGSASATGEIGVGTEVTGSIMDGKWSVTMLSREFPFYKIFDFTTEEGSP